MSHLENAVPHYTASFVHKRQSIIAMVFNPDFGKETVQLHCKVEWTNGAEPEKCVVDYDSFEEFYQDFPQYR